MFAFIFTTVIFTVNADAQALNEILNRIDAHRKDLTSMRANISMGTYNPQIKDWSNSSGKVMYVPKSKKNKEDLIRLDWKEPREEILAVVKGKYYAYTPHLKTVHTGAADSKNAKNKGGSVFAFLSMSKAQMNANYKIALAGTEKLQSGIDTFRLRITPKAGAENAEIWVDINGLIHQVKTISANKDERTFLLSKIETNVTLNIKDFEVKWPSSIKPIKG